LSEPIQKAVFGNVGSIISFRVGPEDAEFLEKQFAPVFTKADLINLDNFNFCVKLSIGGQVSRAFNMKSIYLPEKDLDIKKIEKIREYSLFKYGRSCRVIEQEIMTRWKVGAISDLQEEEDEEGEEEE
jgi:hypothetical protein